MSHSNVFVRILRAKVLSMSNERMHERMLQKWVLLNLFVVINSYTIIYISSEYTLISILFDHLLKQKNLKKRREAVVLYTHHKYSLIKLFEKPYGRS